MSTDPDRLSGLDSSFLHLERGTSHMHVGGAMLFDGAAPPYDELLEHIAARLHRVPRYRQRLAFVPLHQGRPMWVDDPAFNIRFHVRHTALPSPGDDEQLKRLCGRIFSQALDRARPLWELWLVEGLARGGFALVSKTHHALVDGISGVDIATVLFDTARQPVGDAPAFAPRWTPRPLPSGAQLLGDALLERVTAAAGIARGLPTALRRPHDVGARLAGTALGVAAVARAGLRSAPPSPLNVRIGPHRRFTWVQGDLQQFKAIKNTVGGTVNDVVLAAVAGALRRHLRRHDALASDSRLRAMVPVSVRADVERGALGNRVAAMWVTLPVGEADPRARLAAINREMRSVKSSGQAVGARALTELAAFAPPTIMAQAARLSARQRMFNLVVTNVPGPQHPLYMLGRRLQRMFPMVPLAPNQALGIAIISYDGQLDFGLNGDYDALADVELLAQDLLESIDELGTATGAVGARDGVGRKRRIRSAPVAPANQ
jgi:WS/DGAT/MGAT family acyltransferase